MPFPTAPGVPASFTQGDTVVFSYSGPALPPPGWELKAKFVRAGAAPDPIAGQINGDGSFTFSLSALDSGLLDPGGYQVAFVAVNSSSGERWTDPCRRSTFVRPDPLIPLKQTWAMATLAALQAGYAKLIAGTISSFSGGGQSWTKKNIAELEKAMDRLQVKADADLARLGLPGGGAGSAKTIVACF